MSLNVEHGLFTSEQEENPYPYIYEFKNEMDHDVGLSVYQILKKYYSDPSKYRFEGYGYTNGNFTQDIVELWSTEEIELSFELKKYLIDKGIKKTMSVKKPIIKSIGTEE
jgi:hypothetical protein